MLQRSIILNFLSFKMSSSLWISLIQQSLLNEIGVASDVMTKKLSNNYSLLNTCMNICAITSNKNVFLLFILSIEEISLKKIWRNIMCFV